MVKREFYKCDIRVKKAYFKRKRGKVIFLRKRCWQRQKGVVLYLSYPVRTRRNAENAVRETAERRRFHGEIGGKRKENIWTTKKVLTNARRCGKINRLSPPLSGRERKKKSKKCLTKATEYDIMNKLLNAKAWEGKAKRTLKIKQYQEA